MCYSWFLVHFSHDKCLYSFSEPGIASSSMIYCSLISQIFLQRTVSDFSLVNLFWSIFLFEAIGELFSATFYTIQIFFKAQFLISRWFQLRRQLSILFENWSQRCIKKESIIYSCELWYINLFIESYTCSSSCKNQMHYPQIVLTLFLYFWLKLFIWKNCFSYFR